MANLSGFMGRLLKLSAENIENYGNEDARFPNIPMI